MLLPLLLAAAAAGQPFASPMIQGSGCRAARPFTAAGPPVQPGVRKLGELPPAKHLYAVLRQVEGCPVLQIAAPGRIQLELAPGFGGIQPLAPSRDPGTSPGR